MSSLNSETDQDTAQSPSIGLKYPQPSFLPSAMAPSLLSVREQQDFDAQSDYTHSSLGDDGFDIISHRSADVSDDDDDPLDQALGSSIASLSQRSTSAQDEGEQEQVSSEDKDGHEDQEQEPSIVHLKSVEESNLTEIEPPRSMPLGSSQEDLNIEPAESVHVPHIQPATMLQEDTAKYLHIGPPFRVLFLGPDAYHDAVLDKLLDVLSLSPEYRQVSLKASDWSIYPLSDIDNAKAVPLISRVPSRGTDIVFHSLDERSEVETYHLTIFCQDAALADAENKDHPALDSTVPCMRLLYGDDQSVQEVLSNLPDDGDADIYDTTMAMSVFCERNAHALNKLLAYLSKKQSKVSSFGQAFWNAYFELRALKFEVSRKLRAKFEAAHPTLEFYRRITFWSILTIAVASFVQNCLTGTGGSVLMWSVNSQEVGLNVTQNAINDHTTSHTWNRSLDAFSEILPYKSGLSLSPQQVIVARADTPVRLYQDEDGIVFLKVAEVLLGKKYTPNLVIDASAGGKPLNITLRRANLTMFEIQTNRKGIWQPFNLHFTSHLKNVIIADQHFRVSPTGSKALMALSSVQKSISEMLPNNTVCLRKDVVHVRKNAARLGQSLIKLGSDSTDIMAIRALRGYSALNDRRKDVMIRSKQVGLALLDTVDQRKAALAKAGRVLHQSKKQLREDVVKNIGKIKVQTKNLAKLSKSRASKLRSTAADQSSMLLRKARNRASRLFKGTRKVNHDRSRDSREVCRNRPRDSRKASRRSKAFKVTTSSARVR